MIDEVDHVRMMEPSNGRTASILLMNRSCRTGFRTRFSAYSPWSTPLSSVTRTRQLDNAITPDGVYKLVRRYALGLGLKIGAHALRA